MESYGLDMDDLFDDRAAVNENLENFSDNTQDDLERDLDREAEQVNGEEDGNLTRQVEEQLRQLGQGAAKKRVLRPQPKLDPARLTGERGIPVLPKVFENVTYKGKGHEARDLNIMMAAMEHWAHRLFPKMPFDEVVERIEKLGQKKAVQTVVNKIRLDMPVLSNDFVSQEDSDAEREEPQDQIDVPEPNYSSIDNHEDDDEVLNEILQQEENPALLSASTPYPKKNVSKDFNEAELTPEQVEKIRKNAEMAQERRKRRKLDAAPDDDEAADEGNAELQAADVSIADEECCETTTNSSLPDGN